MPTYNYRCEHCGHEEARKEKFGAPREHECPKCGETAKRFIGELQEATMTAVTPGGCSEYSKENRSANRIMSRIKEKRGEDPYDDPNMLAADRHQGKKNGLVPGSRGE